MMTQQHQTIPVTSYSYLSNHVSEPEILYHSTNEKGNHRHTQGAPKNPSQSQSYTRFQQSQPTQSLAPNFDNAANVRDLNAAKYNQNGSRTRTQYGAKNPPQRSTSSDRNQGNQSFSTMQVLQRKTGNQSLNTIQYPDRSSHLSKSYENAKEMRKYQDQVKQQKSGVMAMLPDDRYKENENGPNSGAFYSQSSNKSMNVQYKNTKSSMERGQGQIGAKISQGETRNSMNNMVIPKLQTDIQNEQTSHTRTNSKSNLIQPGRKDKKTASNSFAAYTNANFFMGSSTNGSKSDWQNQTKYSQPNSSLSQYDSTLKQSGQLTAAQSYAMSGRVGRNIVETSGRNSACSSTQASYPGAQSTTHYSYAKDLPRQQAQTSQGGNQKQAAAPASKASQQSSTSLLMQLNAQQQHQQYLMTKQNAPHQQLLRQKSGDEAAIQQAEFLTKHSLSTTGGADARHLSQHKIPTNQMPAHSMLSMFTTSNPVKQHNTIQSHQSRGLSKTAQGHYPTHLEEAQERQQRDSAKAAGPVSSHKNQNSNEYPLARNFNFYISDKGKQTLDSDRLDSVTEPGSGKEDLQSHKIAYNHISGVSVETAEESSHNRSIGENSKSSGIPKSHKSNVATGVAQYPLPVRNSNVPSKKDQSHTQAQPQSRNGSVQGPPQKPQKGGLLDIEKQFMVSPCADGGSRVIQKAKTVTDQSQTFTTVTPSESNISTVKCKAKLRFQVLCKILKHQRNSSESGGAKTATGGQKADLEFTKQQLEAVNNVLEEVISNQANKYDFQTLRLTTDFIHRAHQTDQYMLKNQMMQMQRDLDRSKQNEIAMAAEIASLKKQQEKSEKLKEFEIERSDIAPKLDNSCHSVQPTYCRGRNSNVNTSMDHRENSLILSNSQSHVEARSSSLEYKRNSNMVPKLDLTKIKNPFEKQHQTLQHKKEKEFYSKNSKKAYQSQAKSITKSPSVISNKSKYSKESCSHKDIDVKINHLLQPRSVQNQNASVKSSISLTSAQQARQMINQSVVNKPSAKLQPYASTGTRSQNKSNDSRNGSVNLQNVQVKVGNHVSKSSYLSQTITSPVEPSSKKSVKYMHEMQHSSQQNITSGKNSIYDEYSDKRILQSGKSTSSFAQSSNQTLGDVSSTEVYIDDHIRQQRFTTIDPRSQPLNGNDQSRKRSAPPVKVPLLDFSKLQANAAMNNNIAKKKSFLKSVSSSQKSGPIQGLSKKQALIQQLKAF